MLFQKKSQVDFFLHELKSPVSAMIGAIEALKNFENLTPEQRKRFIQIIDQKTARLKTMLDNTLLPSEKKMKSVILRELIDQTLQQWSDAIEEKKLNIKIELPEQVKILAYPKKISMVFSNLIDNAIKYSPVQGLITITGQIIRKKIRMTVADQGAGIEAKEVKKIFNRYYRTQNTKGIPGHGLGLAIVKEVLREHRSTARVYSQLGKGTSFIFELPLVNH